MAQTPSQRRTAQRRLAKDLKAGKPIFTPAEKGQVKAAKVLKIRMSVWNRLPPEQRERLREQAAKGEKRVTKYIAELDAGKTPEWPGDEWETWEWEMYKEATT